MSDLPEQRWGKAPRSQWDARTVLPKWRNGDAARVFNFVMRQHSEAIAAWLTERTGLYAAAHPELLSKEWEREAMLDLICWQRRQGKAGEMLEWLRGYEAMVAAGENLEGRKTGKAKA